MNPTIPMDPFDPTAPLADGIARIEASAGTGKTYALTDQVVRTLAESDVTADRIVIVTFTRAAAAELRGRVRLRIREVLAAFDTPPAAGTDAVIDHLIDADDATCTVRRRRLESARARFDDLTIDTIHGFCQRVLQQLSSSLGVETGAELREDVGPIIDGVVADLWIREVRGADAPWLRLLAERRVTPDRLTSILRQFESVPGAVLTPRPESQSAAQLWDDEVAAFIDRWHAQADALLQWLTDAQAAGSFGRTRTFTPKALADIRAQFDDFSAAPVLGRVDALGALATLTRSAITDRIVDEARIPDALDVVDAAARLVDLPRRVAEAFQSRFVVDAFDELDCRKRTHGVWSFTDLLRTLDDALADPMSAGLVADAIHSRLDVAFIDEFQDTDPVQWRIFSTLFADRRLVLVGDPKQAIYSFRGADITTYLAAARDATEPVATLPTNYRSDQRVIDALDTLFDPVRFADGGPFADPAIAYTAVRAADANAADRLDDPSGAPFGLGLRVVTRTTVGDTDGTIAKSRAEDAVPRLVADEIVAMLSGDVHIDREDVARELRPGDIAVLTRTNAQATRTQAALRAVGVPAVVAADHSVFDSVEAGDVERFLAALHEPTSQRRVRAVLAGPVLGWSLADIDRLDDARWSTVIDQLLDWAASWRSHGVAVAFRRALAANDAFARLAAQPGGDRVLTNLGHVVELLHREASRRHLGPAALLQWLRRQRDRVDDRTDDSELRLDRDDDAVQVLTVHRAKGLQFPVVFSPFLWTGAVRRTADAVVRVRDDIEGGMIVDIGFDDAVAPRDRHVVLARRQQWQEDIRLAYVALTRARHRNVVHFGSIAGASGTGLHRLLLASRPDGDVTSFEPDATTMSDDELRDQLDRFTGAAITVTDAPADVRGVPWQDEHRDRPHVHLRTVQRPLDRQWQRTSFTRLVHTPVAGADEHAGDFDETAQTEVQDTDVHGPVDEVPLARFPRGPAVGTAVHRMLEHLDFADGGRDHLVAHVDRFAREFTGDERRQLVDGVARALVTPLGGTLGDIALAAIARSDRRDELSFDLPVAGGVRGGPAVSLHALADVFAAHDGATDAPLGPLADRLRRRPDHRFRGMLTGSIDLVARVGDRYFLADYKTNWLGSRDAAGVEQSTVADYHLDRIRDVMVTHDYVLQYHLYLVALHRYLRLRLADYDYDTHIAGAAYLFLRGMLGTAQPADTGVYVDRPARALIEALDDTLRGTR